MRLKDFMNTDVETVRSETSAEEAWERMRARDIRHLVVARGGTVLGVVSDRDLGGRRGAALRRGKTVADVMTTAPVTARPETTLRQAANLMRGRSVGCLPVVGEDGRLQGIVTITDILDVVGRGSFKPNESEPGNKKRKARNAPPRLGSPPGRR